MLAGHTTCHLTVKIKPEGKNSKGIIYVRSRLPSQDEDETSYPGADTPSTGYRPSPGVNY